MLHIRSKRTKKAIANEIISRVHKNYWEMNYDEMIKHYDLFMELIPHLTVDEYNTFKRSDDFNSFMEDFYTYDEQRYFDGEKITTKEEADILWFALIMLSNHPHRDYLCEKFDCEEKKVIQKQEDEIDEEIANGTFDWARFDTISKLNITPREICDFQFCMNFLCGSDKYGVFMGASKYGDCSIFSTRMGFFASERFKIKDAFVR